MTLQNIFPDGTIEYDGQIGFPDDFPLTDAERAEVENPGIPASDPPPAPDYFAFWDALLISSVYQSIRAQALTNPAVLVTCTEFIAAITDAKAGRPNVPAIQTCINYLLSAGTFTEAELIELGELLAVGNLQDTYTLA